MNHPGNLMVTGVVSTFLSLLLNLALAGTASFYTNTLPSQEDILQNHTIFAEFCLKHQRNGHFRAHYRW